MIRKTTPQDHAALVDLARATGVFREADITALEEVLDDYHAQMCHQGHICLTETETKAVRAFVYYAPAAMTDGTWYLWWIAVHPDQQARGLGTQLMAHVEADIRQRGGRQLFIETSSMPAYEPTRRFYTKLGYEKVAVLPDYYVVGDDMVIFRKRFD